MLYLAACQRLCGLRKEKGECGLCIWPIHRESYNEVGYNHGSHPADASPRKFDDLLNPEFRRKMGFPNGVAVVKTAPHPHAASLLADFILSPRGQKIFGELDFADSAKDRGGNRFYPEHGLTSAQDDDQKNYWLKLLRNNGRK